MNDREIDTETLKRLSELHDRLDGVFEELRALGARLDKSTSKFESTAKLVAEIHGTWNIEAGDAGTRRQQVIEHLDELYGLE